MAAVFLHYEQGSAPFTCKIKTELGLDEALAKFATKYRKKHGQAPPPLEARGHNDATWRALPAKTDVFLTLTEGKAPERPKLTSRRDRLRKIPRFCSNGSSVMRNPSRKPWKRHWASRGGKITDRAPPSAKFRVGIGRGIVFCFPLPRVSSLALQLNLSRLRIPGASPKKLRTCTSAGCTGQMWTIGQTGIR